MEGCSVLEKPKALVLYSGGKDSILATCDVVTAGYEVILLSCNCGALVAEENLLYGVKQLQRRFGADVVSYAGCSATVAVINRLSEYYVNTPAEKFARNFPSLTPCQIRCLNCQSTMWVAAIAYAVAHDIKCIACGYKATDEFCTGMQSYWDNLISIAGRYNLLLLRPEWDLSSDFERDKKMIYYGLYPAVLEPKCLLGTPATPLGDSERKDMQNYFMENLYVNMWEQIENLSKIFKHIRLSTKAYMPIYSVDEE